MEDKTVLMNDDEDSHLSFLAYQHNKRDRDRLSDVYDNVTRLFKGQEYAEADRESLTERISKLESLYSTMEPGVLQETIVECSSFDKITEDDIVSGLKSAGICDRQDELRQLVINLEAAETEEVHDDFLKGFLFDYIQSNKNSSEYEDIIAVSSSIRKLVSLVDIDDMHILVSLLNWENAVPSLEIELEIVKMISRKLVSQTGDSIRDVREIADVIKDIAVAYTHHRILPRELNAAIAMNAIIALSLMSEEIVSELIVKLQYQPIAWFEDLLRRRLIQVREQLVNKSQGEEEIRIARLDNVIRKMNHNA